MRARVAEQSERLADLSAQVAATSHHPNTPPVVPAASAADTSAAGTTAGLADTTTSAGASGATGPTFNVTPSKPKVFSGHSGKGGVTVDAWLFTLVTYFEAANMPEPKRVPFAASSLEGHAAVWWRSRVGSKGAQCTFEEFSAELTSAFQPVDPVRSARAKLYALRQTGTVEEYSSAVQSCLFYLPGMAMEDKVHVFTAGLKVEVHREVVRREPLTLEDAIAIAAKEEALLREVQRRARTASASGATMSRANVVAGAPARSFKCWNCEHEGHAAQNCPEPKNAAKIKLGRDLHRKSGNAWRR